MKKEIWIDDCLAIVECRVVADHAAPGSPAGPSTVEIVGIDPIIGDAETILQLLDSGRFDELFTH